MFSSEIDLKSHTLEEHPQGLSKSALKEARRVDISGFDLGRLPPPGRGHGGGGGGRGRGGRPPYDAEPLAVTPGHMSRAEIALQRQVPERTVQSASSATTRAFGGHLTPREPQQQPATASQPSPPSTTRLPATTRATEGNFPPLANLNISGAAPRPEQAPLPRKEQPTVTLEVAAKHAQTIDRAAQLLNGDSGKVNNFKTVVSDYNSARISPADFVDEVRLEMSSYLREANILCSCNHYSTYRL